MFEKTSLTAWKERAEQSLGGGSFDDRLCSRTTDGIAIQPLYDRGTDAPALPVARPAGRWRLIQRIDHPVPSEANKLAHMDLDNGADGFELLFAASPNAHGYGLVTESANEFDAAVGDLLERGVRLWLDAGQEARHLIAFLLITAERRGIPAERLDVCAGFDFLSNWASNGSLSAPLDLVEQRLVDMIQGVRERGFASAIFKSDGRIWHAAGASEVQELAYTLASAISYLRLYERAGVEPSTAIGLIDLTLAADSDQFLTIAKFRALQQLWTAVQTACGIAPKPARIHAETSWRMLTRRDPHSNILRATTAAFAAAVGGAASISVLPFSAAWGLPDPFARRISRNIQHILMEESFVHWVWDPAAGSGAVEALSGEMARSAWALLQSIEAAGGMGACLRAGTVQEAIARTRAAMGHDIATGARPIIGTSAFVNLSESPVKTIDTSMAIGIEFSEREWALAEPVSGNMFESVIEAARAGATLADLVASRRPNQRDRAPALVFERLAKPYDRLRRAADRFAISTGERPRILLVCLGGAADYQGRAAWARTLFEAGGIETVTVPEIASPMEAFDAYSRSGTKAVCLCASDTVLAEQAEQTAEALRVAGALHVFCVTEPGANAERFAEAGVGTFIHEGSDMVAVLQHVHEVMGMAQAD